eukprot:m.94814 g.94814  ORF g.94814 m.94814 type:complete len:129 (+) comp13461_c0_seq2:206-592(+)
MSWSLSNLKAGASDALLAAVSKVDQVLDIKEDPSTLLGKKGGSPPKRGSKTTSTFTESIRQEIKEDINKNGSQANESKSEPVSEEVEELEAGVEEVVEENNFFQEVDELSQHVLSALILSKLYLISLI